MTLCALFRCEYEAEPGSTCCFRHQDSGHGDVTAEPFDPELSRLRRQLTCIEAVVVAYDLSPIDAKAAMREISELLWNPR